MPNTAKNRLLWQQYILFNRVLAAVSETWIEQKQNFSCALSW